MNCAPYYLKVPAITMHDHTCAFIYLVVALVLKVVAPVEILLKLLEFCCMCVNIISPGKANKSMQGCSYTENTLAPVRCQHLASYRSLNPLLHCP